MLRFACRLIAYVILALATFAGFQAIVMAYSGPLSEAGLRQRSSARVGTMAGAIPLTDGVKLIHRFRVEHHHWTAFRVQTVTWGHPVRPGRCLWVLYELRDGDRVEVRRGRFRASDVTDWGILSEDFAEIPDSGGRMYELVFSAPQTALLESAGLALYQLEGGESSTLLKDTRQGADPLNLPVDVEHPGIGPMLTLIHRRGEG